MTEEMMNSVTKGNHDYLEALISQPYQPENSIVNALKAAFVDLADTTNTSIAKLEEEVINGETLINLIINALRKVADDWQAADEALRGVMN